MMEDRIQKALEGLVSAPGDGNMSLEFEKRPWGCFMVLADAADAELGPVANVKVIMIQAYSKMSLQSHEHRDERFFVVSGDLHFELNGVMTVLQPSDIAFVPRYGKHRLGAQHEQVVLIEVSYGTFDEDDIVRYADDYGRT